jgi:uroporphyrinogen III methyltransferase/synthase
VAEPGGVVYLVGAGPGDPGLLTRRGAQLLREAEVVVYDRLVSPRVLDFCRSDCERRYVGKAGGGDSVPQREITRLLVELGVNGRRVVRLKGGDPFVFGRGGEEALALQEAGVPFEIVPGVSAAVAAPAYAGIPVTHRGVASSVTIATGHEDPEKPGSSLNWSGLAQGSDTLVFLMGVERLEEITERLVANGRSPSEPAALVRWGTTPKQESLRATLGTIAEIVRERGLLPPATLVVGRVVELADRLGWFQQRPLFGKRILVTRSRDQASQLVDRLAALGADPIEFPTIRIEPLADTAALDGALGTHANRSWVLFTSANGVRAAFTRLAAHGRDARAFSTTRVGAIGGATAACLLEHGIRADFVPGAFTSEAIANDLAPLLSPADDVLLLRADIAPPTLSQRLATTGARLSNVVAYHTRPDRSRRDELAGLLDRGEIDVVTFTSASTVRNLLDALEPDLGLPDHVTVACIGPVTASAARERGLRVDAVATNHTIGGLVEAITAHCASGLPSGLRPGGPVEVSP